MSHRSEADLHRLVNVLDIMRNDRNGVFFVGRLDGQEQHEEIAQALSQHLAQRGVSVVRYRFLPESPVETSFAGMVEVLSKVKAKGERSVLVVWCLEHLKDPKLSKIADRFKDYREQLSQNAKSDEATVPIVLLVDQVYYRYLPGDLLEYATSVDLSS